MIITKIKSNFTPLLMALIISHFQISNLFFAWLLWLAIYDYGEGYKE